MLTRIINKTPLLNEKSNVYQVDQIDGSLLSSIIQSRFIGEGVYSLEQYSIDDYKEQYLITPSFDKFNYSTIQKDWNFKEDITDLTIFELVLDKPLFMPLDVKPFVDMLNAIDSSVFIQVLLCKRLDNWREMAITQYESYLSGNDHPLEGKLGIKIQQRMLKVLNKISNYSVQRSQIEEIEQKILQNNYRFECRFIIFDDKYVPHFVSKVEKTLSKLQLFNEFRLKKVQNKKNFIRYIENREFQSDLVNQLLSEQEIFSLLTDGKVQTITKVALEKPIKQQSMLRNIEDSMLLQKAIQLMPLGENKNVEIDESKVQMINQAFKRVGIIDKPMKVSEIYQGCSLLKVQFKYPTDITYTKISKKTEDIQGALGNQNIIIEMGNQPDTINVFLPLEKRDVLYFRNVLESIEFQEYKNDKILPFIIGENVNGGYMFADLTELRHILIAGATGGGKSIFVNLIILSLLLNVPTDEIVMYLIDPKMVEFTQFKGFPQVKEVITDMKKANGVLCSLCVEMDRRYEVFANAGVRDIQGYNESGKGKMNYIICAVDEFADLMMVNNLVEESIVRLGQKARGAGIHLILATQRPSVDVVTGLIKANMPTRVAFSVTSAVDSKTILDKGGAEKLLGRGDGLAKIEGNRNEFERFQSPVLTLYSKEETKIYEELRKLFDGVGTNEDSLPDIIVESEIDKLKRIIATTGELRVSELQNMMGIRINKVSELLKELVDEGWLRKEGRSYEVNVNDEELNNWRDNNVG